MAQSLPPRIERAAGAQNRSSAHVWTGLALTAAAVGLSWWVSARNAPSPLNPQAMRRMQQLEQPPFEPPPAVFGLVWPPLFSALALAGWRLWNAPDSRARTQALLSWATVQGLNGLAMRLQARGRRGLAALAVAGSAAASWLLTGQARRIDPPSAALTAPHAGWVTFATLLAEELWRRNRRSPV